MNTTLENNSKDMATIVETFLVEETVELIYDNEKLEEWNKAINDLGLKGQGQIVKKDKSPIPFLFMKQNLINVFETLCPVKSPIENYSTTAIPVEILKLVLLSKKEEYFKNIEIWYDDVKPDPICVGMTGHWEEYDWYGDSNKALKGIKFNSLEEAKAAGATHAHFSLVGRYLIGKWGDVKHSFQELQKMAYARFIEVEDTRIQKARKELDRELEDLKLKASEKFAI